MTFTEILKLRLIFFDLAQSTYLRVNFHFQNVFREGLTEFRSFIVLSRVVMLILFISELTRPLASVKVGLAHKLETHFDARLGCLDWRKFHFYI